jgi:hypothetical protein
VLDPDANVEDDGAAAPPCIKGSEALVGSVELAGEEGVLLAVEVDDDAAAVVRSPERISFSALIGSGPADSRLVGRRGSEVSVAGLTASDRTPWKASDLLESALLFCPAADVFVSDAKRPCK